MIKHMKVGALIGLGLGIAIFVCGPMLIAAYDMGCWFLLAQQCTTVEWTIEKKMWATAPLFLAFIAFIGGTM